MSRVFKLEVPSFLDSSSINQRWIAENLAVIGPMEVFECVNENFQNNYEFWKGATMLARGRLSKKIFFAYFVFRGSIGIYQSDQTSRIVKKFINQCTLLRSCVTSLFLFIVKTLLKPVLFWQGLRQMWNCTSSSWGLFNIPCLWV